MIERFNFYDLYAYLVPGLALIGALWVPFGVISLQWPSNDFVSAAGFALAGYVVGIMLHEVASNAPWAYLSPLPSDRMLDEKDQLLRPELRALVLGKMASRFGLVVSGQELRNPAFRVARTGIVHDRRGSYVEQFSGLQGMTRSLSLAALMAFSWYAGWATYALRADTLGWLWTPGTVWLAAGGVSAALGVVSLILHLKSELRSNRSQPPAGKDPGRAWSRWLVLAWPGTLFVAGVFAASRRGVTWPHLSLLWAPMLGAVSAWLIFWRTSNRYAHLFALEVYLALIADPSEKREEAAKPPEV